MIFGSCVFALLFIFLFFILVTAIMSLFQKKSGGGYEPKVSVVIPCYNEEKNILS